MSMYQENARQLEQKDLAHRDLARTAKADEDNYLLYLHKREEARMADALDEQRILNVSIIETPTVPALPTADRWRYGLLRHPARSHSECGRRLYHGVPRSVIADAI